MNLKNNKDDGPAPFAIHQPSLITSPVVYASPHSGTFYPPDLLASTTLDHQTLRTSEDSYVDALFAQAVDYGSPLLSANYARVYIDVNREPWELDPTMFNERLPSHVNTTSLRVASGFGTIARLVADGKKIYQRKLDFQDAENRISNIYYPYHAALNKLITQSFRIFNCCILIDCHSMPSLSNNRSGSINNDRGDVVLGDRFGTTCSPNLINFVESTLSSYGLMVKRNAPYAGGFTTYNYGRPGKGLHTLQIEFNRALYMNESLFTCNTGFSKLRYIVGELINKLTQATIKDYGKIVDAAE